MDERNMMENLLLTTKGVCELYMHGAIEASTPEVRSAFCTALNDTLAIQDSIYKDMSLAAGTPLKKRKSPSFSRCARNTAAEVMKDCALRNFLTRYLSKGRGVSSSFLRVVLSVSRSLPEEKSNSVICRDMERPLFIFLAVLLRL